MSAVVWKYPLPLDQNDHALVVMPAGARIVWFEYQPGHENPVVWALVNPDEKHWQPRQFCVYPTGKSLPFDPELIAHRGTAFLSNGTIVMHCLEMSPPAGDAP